MKERVYFLLNMQVILAKILRIWSLLVLISFRLRGLFLLGSLMVRTSSLLLFIVLLCWLSWVRFLLSLVLLVILGSIWSLTFLNNLRRLLIRTATWNSLRFWNVRLSSFLLRGLILVLKVICIITEFSFWFLPFFAETTVWTLS